ncbi:MAG: hypothetical protein HYU99_11770 [Deltaproteobacteria bacterium]|nr:hypothetical protein [Deltaproteobacteria bacterium]
MTPEIIDQFFLKLAETLDKPATVILIGGAAALLFGGARPTEDIDFGINGLNRADKIADGISAARKETGVKTEYSEDIERWSMLTLLDYKKHTRPYKIFGKLKVTILEPEYWSIGKAGRYYDSDIQDMITVFKSQKTDSARLLRVWARSLRESPLSDDLFHFKKHVVHFMKTYGREIWGNRFNAEKALREYKFQP